MGKFVYIEDKPAVDWDHQVASDISVTNNATDTEILLFTCKNGKIPYITSFRQAWDAGMDTFVTYWLEINGTPHQRFWRTTAQLAAPESDYRLPVPEEISQGARVRVMANLAAGGTSGNFTAVVDVEYKDP